MINQQAPIKCGNIALRSFYLLRARARQVVWAVGTAEVIVPSFRMRGQLQSSDNTIRAHLQKELKR